MKYCLNTAQHCSTKLMPIVRSRFNWVSSTVSYEVTQGGGRLRDHATARRNGVSEPVAQQLNVVKADSRAELTRMHA